MLKSELLRSYANYISYKDKSFATSDALNLGRLHCLRQTWEDNSVAFLLSGGFIVSNKIQNVQQKTLILWGKDDKILSPDNALKFKEILPDSELFWVADCGHVPHLEKPKITADVINKFLCGEKIISQ